MVPGSPRVEQVDVVDEPARVVRARRTWRQRLLLGTGVVLSCAAIAAAATVGWTVWKLNQVDRTDVSLDDAEGGPANYLIVGSDTRSAGDPNDPRARDDHKPLADTIMILRIDPHEKRAKILSLPRDLWVTLSGTGGKTGRINAAYATGGPQRLVDTLQDQLEIPINHYVEVDFHGFQEVVSAVGGVPMWFDRAMRDRNSGLDVLHPGCTTLDGYGALAFARARHLEYFSHGGFTYDGTGDLGRISRQQLFMRRLIDRAKSKGIRNPLTLKRLVEAGTSNVTIDKGLSVGDLLDLGSRFSDFDSDSLVSYTLPTTPRTTSGGAAVLDLSAFKATPILNQFRPADELQQAGKGSGKGSKRSGPQVPDSEIALSVLNSSGRQGLATDVADALVAEGFDVSHWGNGAELKHGSESKTTIRYAPGTDSMAVRVAAKVEGGVVLEEDTTLDDGAVVLFLGGDFTKVGEAGGTITTSVETTSTSSPASTSTTPATTTSTTAPKPTPVVGMIPGDPPEGKSCG